jgi:hypothetical protein
MLRAVSESCAVIATYCLLVLDYCMSRLLAQGCRLGQYSKVVRLSGYIRHMEVQGAT